MLSALVTDADTVPAIGMPSMVQPLPKATVTVVPFCVTVALGQAARAALASVAMLAALASAVLVGSMVGSSWTSFSVANLARASAVGVVPCDAARGARA